MKFEAVLFDLDGTLLNTLTDLATSANNALTELGFHTHPTNAYCYFVGKGMDGLVKQILPARSAGDEKLIAAATELAKKQYSIHWADTTAPYDGIAELLNALDKLGVIKTVFSNKPDKYTRLIIKRFLSDFSFTIVRGVCESVPKKPDPTAAINIANELSIQPEKFLYLGDSDTDMQTATAAGMFPVGALWGYRDADELNANGAKFLAAHPLDLLELFNG